MSKVAITDIQAAGVVGAGGAGFPTHVKLAGRVDTVVLNAAECEPLLHKDKEILRNWPEQVLAGLATAMELTGAAHGIVGIKEKYTDVIDQLRPLLGEGMSIYPLRDAYPVGDEFVLIYDTLGRVVPPGGIPLDVGAASMNVETAFNVAASAAGPVTSKFVSIAGAVKEPVTIRVPVGITLSQCVAAAGGPAVAAANYIVGGVMMGYIEDDPDALIDKRTGAIIVLPSDHVVVRRYRRDWTGVSRIGRAACDQCSFCTELCPRYLLGHPIEPAKAMRSLGFNQVGQSDVLGTVFCSQCNLCSMYACPEDLDPKSVCGENKQRLAAEGVKWTDPPFNPRRAQLHMDNRKAPTARLFSKLDLGRFRNVGPLVDEMVQTDRVGIKLGQHVGQPCEATVSPGQSVTVGDVVGRPAVSGGKPALGAPVHASISGKVTAIEQEIVWIERQ